MERVGVEWLGSRFCAVIADEGGGADRFASNYFRLVKSISNVLTHSANAANLSTVTLAGRIGRSSSPEVILASAGAALAVGSVSILGGLVLVLVLVGLIPAGCGPPS